MERAKVIKKLIDQTGMSVRAFAEKAGLPYTTLYSMLERGIGKASIENALKVCKALEITVEEIDELASGQSKESYEALMSTAKIERDSKKMTEILAEMIDKQGSRRAFAKKIGIPPTTLQTMLSRDIGRASVLTVLDVCKALGITIEELERMSTDNPDEIGIITALHTEVEDWTNEELGLLEDFKRFIRIRRELHK